MQTNKKIIWIAASTAIAGTGFWLWWRQRNGVPPSAVPIMQQARAVIGTSTTPIASAAASASTDSLLASIIPGYIAQTPQNN